MFPFFAGLAAGLLHAFSGPDHLAAVAPLAADTNRSHWRTGLHWGIGHTAGVLSIAILLLLVREQLPLDAISAYSERMVGLALVGVGIWGMLKAGRATAPSHSHGGASFAMGTIHGLAGSSHLLGVLPALAFATRAESAVYLGGFSAAAVAGMAAFAAGFSALSMRFGRRHHWLYASSLAAVAIGGFWLVSP